MAAHTYKIGQMVHVRANTFGTAPPGLYEVTRLLPPTGMANQYRVKSLKNGQERVVQEDDISRSDP